MDRFFSKLDLRDIKIDPEASFPPDEDAYESTESVSTVGTGKRVTRPRWRRRLGAATF